MFNNKYDIKNRDSRLLEPVGEGLTTAQYMYEFMELVKIYKKIKPKYVVEIGTWHGGTLWYWLKHAVPGATVISIDCGPTYWRPAEPDFDMKQWETWVKPATSLRVIVGNSTDPAIIKLTKSLCPEINFLFIDGDHSYEGAMTDFQNYGPMVNGVVAFHDLIPPPDRARIRVGEVFREIQKAGYLTQEFYSKPNQNRMGIGVVYVERDSL